MITFFSVLYHPTNNALENIVNSKRAGFDVVVFVNAAPPELILQLSAMDVRVMSKSSNVGLGVAFYEFEVDCRTRGVEFFIYFDQDTLVKPCFWNRLLDNAPRDIYGPNVGLVHYGSPRSKDVQLVVSSGCLFSLNVMNAIGLHDPSYFVECVDYEFCFRLKSFGLVIKTISVTDIDHESLQDMLTVRVFGWDFVCRIYGRSRMSDFNHAHFRLLLRSIKLFSANFTWLFLKSLIIFNVREAFSRFLFWIK